MLSGDEFRRILDENQVLVVDGALATELEARGCNLKDSLWSAKVLLNEPDLIRDVHKDYFLAGANIAITASYQASERGLAEQRGFTAQQTELLIRLSVKLAHTARDDARTALSSKAEMLIAGSIGPYGAYMANGEEYTGAYSFSAEEFRDFHRLRLKALVDGGCDMLACETIPSYPEAHALCGLLAQEFPDCIAWISVTLDAHGACMADGTPLDVLAKTVLEYNQIVALGVNCVAREKVTPALKTLKNVVGMKLALLVYPNSGETWNAGSHTWSGNHASSETWQIQVNEWKELGARLVGGCCRTNPDDIRSIVQTLGSRI